MSERFGLVPEEYTDLLQHGKLATSPHPVNVIIYNPHYVIQVYSVRVRLDVSMLCYAVDTVILYFDSPMAIEICCIHTWVQPVMMQHCRVTRQLGGVHYRSPTAPLTACSTCVSCCEHPATNSLSVLSQSTFWPHS